MARHTPTDADMTQDSTRKRFLWLLKNTLNRVTSRMARTRHGPFSLVRHVGRKSGRTYETPVILVQTPEGFIAELTYGDQVNWYRNVIAAGGCVVVHHGKEYRVNHIEPYGVERGRSAYPAPFRFVLKATGRKEFRLLRTSGADAESARPGARPVPGRRLPAGRLTGRLSVLLHQTLTRLAPSPQRPTDLGTSPYTLLTTFRRDGTAVAVPVWSAMASGRLYVRTERSAGKVKRLAANGRAEVAPCDVVGRAFAPGTPARGRVLPADEEPIAERALAGRYGRVREAFERTVDLMRVDMCYLELTPETHA